MYQGQIFALLGHNGAGKTTTISMLTGMTDPTKGYLSVHGETEVQKIREQLGVCPQHDTLYEDLTV
jgi:ATP-binding cassette, subfamily A (ABC1), member 3